MNNQTNDITKGIEALTDDELRQVIIEKFGGILNQSEVEQIFKIITEFKEKIDKQYENDNG